MMIAQSPRYYVPSFMIETGAGNRPLQLKARYAKSSR
jgi:hypothetical protein